jgi:hypothetical protein
MTDQLWTYLDLFLPMFLPTLDTKNQFQLVTPAPIRGNTVSQTTNSLFTTVANIITKGATNEQKIVDETDKWYDYVYGTDEPTNDRYVPTVKTTTPEIMYNDIPETTTTTYFPIITKPTTTLQDTTMFLNSEFEVNDDINARQMTFVAPRRIGPVKRGIH